MSFQHRLHVRILCILFLVLLTHNCDVTGAYNTIYLEDYCKSNEFFILNLGSASDNSSGIVKLSRNNTFLPFKKCIIRIEPPLGFGVVLSVRYLDFRPQYPPLCRNYIRIYDVNQVVKLCGYSNDISEYQSYSSQAAPLRMEIVTTEWTGIENSQINFVITAFTKLNFECEMSMFQCQNSRCIWKGLTCDGHNNCGDQSDEFSNKRSNCGALSLAFIAAIVGGSVALFVILILIPTICCCRYYFKHRRRQHSDDTPPLIHPNARGYGSNSIQNIDYPHISDHERHMDMPPAYCETCHRE